MQHHPLDLIEDSLKLEVLLCRHETYGPHRSKQRQWPFWVVLSVEGGKYSFVTTDPGGRHTAGAGETLVLRPNLPHRVEFIGGGALAVMHLRFVAFSGLDVLGPYNLPPVIRGADAGRIAATQASLARYQCATGATSLERAVHRRELGMRLLRLLLRNADAPGQDPVSRYTAEWLAPVLHHIHSNLDQPIQRKDLTRVAGMSASHFTAHFSEALGMPPMQYVRRIRIQRAMEFLTLSDLSVTVIAERLAFCDPYHFSKQFKAETGLSPRQYRTTMRSAMGEHEAKGG